MQCFGLNESSVDKLFFESIKCFLREQAVIRNWLGYWPCFSVALTST